MITIGIIGTSNLVHHFLHIDKKKFSIKAISGRDKNKLKLFSQKLNCKFFFDHNELINQENIDLIYICLPEYFHYEYIKKSIEKNKNVICEKSFGVSENQISDLVRLANSKNKYLFESFMYFYHNQYDFINKIIDQKKYGQLKNINFINNGFLLDKDNFRLKKEMEGGILNDIGCYAVHLFLKFSSGKYLKSFSFFSKNKDEEVYTSGLVNIFSNTDFYLTGRFSYNLPANNELLLSFEKATIILKNCVSTNKRTIIEINECANNERLFKQNLMNSIINKITNKFYKLFPKKSISKKIIIKSDNPYKNMFNNFYKIINDQQNINDNNSLILDQAKIMEELRR